jgi:hypothetical protein
MNQKRDIEARLERSLRRQVTAPRLDGRFNAAVWSRIAAQGQVASAPMVIRRRTPGWLTACNIAGAIISVLALGYYAAQSFVGLDVGIELPAFTAAQQASFIHQLTPYISAAAVAFGLMFTRPARKLLNSLR